MPASTPLIRLGAVLMLVVSLLLPGPARADAGRWLSSASYGELSQELTALQGPPGGPAPSLNPTQQQRLADLTVLEQAIAASDDRSQVRNASSHSLALFTLSKKAAPGTAPSLGVLAPGHESDDDFAVVGLYVPASVSLQWGQEEGGATAGATARVLRLPDGEVLSVSDALAEPAQANSAAAAGTGAGGQSVDAVVYRLSLPAFALAEALPDLAELPSLSQADIDTQIETAPVD